VSTPVETRHEAPEHLRGALLRYRVMATVVGVLLIVLILVGVPLKYLAGDVSGPQQLGGWITTYLGVAHGWLYMIFLVTAFWLSRKAGWDLPFTIVTLLCGTVPILSFWAEHRATARVRHQDALAAVPGSTAGSR
jgi:integral membrane protein